MNRLKLSSLPGHTVLRIELISGLMVALALIPEAISFSIIAGVDPKVGLYASFTMAVAIAFTGGRPAMISAATGAMALVVVSLVDDHGVEYLIAATVLAGLTQILLSRVGAARLMRFVPRSVMTGFVNALAILIFVAQLPHLFGEGPLVWVLAGFGLALILLMPRIIKSIPGPLVAIVVLTALVLVAGIEVPNVGDEGELPSTIPLLGIPSVPFNLETLQIIAPYSFTLAVVGLLESLMTARLVDDITETSSDKDREAQGQGIANVITGFFGGMAGCAMIGQTMINVKVGGSRTRISTFAAGVFLLILVVGLGSVVAVIPMAALVAVMVFVAGSTFDWHSIRPVTLKLMPRGETVVMLLTVAGTVTTGNLAIGVGLGVLASMVLFARKAAGLVRVSRSVDSRRETATYVVTGEVFFASDQELIDSFRFSEDPPKVTIDFTYAHLWDTSAVAALDSIATHYEKHEIELRLIGLNELSESLHRDLSGQLAAAH